MGTTGAHPRAELLAAKHGLELVNAWRVGSYCLRCSVRDANGNYHILEGSCAQTVKWHVAIDDAIYAELAERFAELESEASQCS